MDSNTNISTVFANNTLNDRKNNDSAREDNGMIVLSITIPIAVVSVIGIVLAIVFVLRRRQSKRLRHENRDKGDNREPKQSKHEASGVANEGFVADSLRQDTIAKSSGRISINSLYVEAAMDNRKLECIDCEYNNRKSERTFYENNGVRNSDSIVCEINGDGQSEHIVYENHGDRLSEPIFYENTCIRQSESIFYENNGDEKAETIVYENNNIESKLNDLFEDEYGYGLFKTKSETNVSQEVDTVYQNTIVHPKELKPVISKGIHSKLENVKVSSAESIESSRKEAGLEQNLDDGEDSLYDHAKAERHEWEDKERDKHRPLNEMVNEEDRPNFQNVYENTPWNSSNDQNATSYGTNANDDEYASENRNIPFYLVLEDDQSNMDNFDQKYKEENESLEYDYASAKNDVVLSDKGNETQRQEDNYSENDNLDRHYFILEKEDDVHEDDSECDSTYTHEYFILEKVDR